MKIGITEQGDPSLDFSWKNKLDTVDGAVIISKGFNSTFKDLLLANQEKLIYHCTITGLDGTSLEPNVINYASQLVNLTDLVNSGFNVNHIVLRLDPIIPNYLYLKCRNTDIDYKYLLLQIICAVRELGITRVRFSFLDLYSHVILRLQNKLNLEKVYQFTDQEKKEWVQYFLNMKEEIVDLSFEACAEELVPNEFKCGCISKKDFEILGLNSDYCKGTSLQRVGCLCPACKTELLNNKHRCSHGCVYCYWKD